MKASSKFAAVLVLCAAVTSARGELKVGDKAPMLGTMEYIKGKPVDFAKDLGKKLYLVEFWATWCPPCKVSIPLLTDVQKRFKDDLVIVSVTSPDPRNTKQMVEQFVKEQGDQMDYTVAFDDSGTTSQKYLLASGAPGIPHAFLVDRKGTIVWQGSPLQQSPVHPALDSVIEGVLAGTFDYEKTNKVIQKFQRLNMYAQMGQWDEFLGGLREILSIDPANQVAISSMLSVYLDPLDDREAMVAWAKGYIDAQKNNPLALSRIADVLATIPDPAARQPGMALDAARRAYEVGQSKPRPEYAASYAAALFQIGQLDRAIALQTEAVGLASGGAKEAETAVLEYYKTCKKLHDEVGG